MKGVLRSKAARSHARCRSRDGGIDGGAWTTRPAEGRAQGRTRLLLDDGKLCSRSPGRGLRASARVVEQGGVLSTTKGINRRGGGLTAAGPDREDMRDIVTAAELDADFLGISFPRSGDDIRWARDLMQKAGGNSLIVAKIERAEAITALEEILDASDAIMVARGDLAVEVGDAVIPAMQKRMIRLARERNKGGDYGDADDGVDDQQPDPDTRRSLRRC